MNDLSDIDLLRRLHARAEVTDLVLRFAHAFDMHDWELLRSTLADEVEVDYQSFRGDPPGHLSADEFVERRRRALSHLRMQHLSTNHLVEVTGEVATCRSCFVIHRLDPRLPDGENTLDTTGHYVHRCRRTPEGWKITAIAQVVLWTRGNPEVHGALRTGAPASPA